MNPITSFLVVAFTVAGVALGYLVHPYFAFALFGVALALALASNALVGPDPARLPVAA